jgi:hypothetical protein
MYMGTRARLNISKVVHWGRTDNTIAKKETKGQTMITKQYTENQRLSYTNSTRNQGVNLGAPEGWPAPAPQAAPIELLLLQTRCILCSPNEMSFKNVSCRTNKQKIKKRKQNYPQHEINAFTNHNLRTYKQISINNSCSSQLYNLQSIHTATNVQSIVSCTSILCYFLLYQFSLNIFICYKQDKRIRHKLYNLGCRLRYLHDIHTLTYTEINYITLPK